jgi:hypothetical protein
MFCLKSHCFATSHNLRCEQKPSVLGGTNMAWGWKIAGTNGSKHRLLAPMNSISGGSWQQFVHVIHKHSHIVFDFATCTFHKSSGGNSPSWVSLYSKTASRILPMT